MIMYRVTLSDRYVETIRHIEADYATIAEGGVLVFSNKVPHPQPEDDRSVSTRMYAQGEWRDLVIETPKA